MGKYKLRLSDEAMKSYQNYKQKDKKTFERILSLLKNMEETPFSGIGKPEPLKYDLSGFWSRRIDKKNRIIYEVTNERRNQYYLYYSNRKSL